MNDLHLLSFLILFMIGIFPIVLLFIKCLEYFDLETYKGFSLFYLALIVLMGFTTGLAITILEVLG